MFTGSEYIGFDWDSKSLDKCMLYIVRFVKKERKLDKRNFFYKDRIKMWQDNFSIDGLFHSNSLAISNGCIHYLPNGAFILGKHIFLLSYYIKTRKGRINTDWSLNSNGKVNCKICIYSKKRKAISQDKRIPTSIRQK
jgi:hypothetical protein